MITSLEGIELLHNQSTNNIQALAPGQGCETVFVKATAEIIDLTTAYRWDDRILLLTSPEYRTTLRDHLKRLLMFVRGSQLIDLTDEQVVLRLVGPTSESVLKQLGITPPKELHSHDRYPIAGGDVRVAVGSGLQEMGFILIVDKGSVSTLWSMLIEAGAVPGQESVWQHLTIEQGRPLALQELTDTHNPIEAGLWRAISLSKGCYIGQEVLAKQVTYHRIRQTLWGIRSDQTLKAGSDVALGEQKAGSLTRVTADGHQGLAYIRTKMNPQPGMQVTVAGISAELIELPLCSYPDE